MPHLTFDVLVTPAARHEAMREDVVRGLISSPKSLPPVWFYDEAGSKLFDQITRLPEYYLTRAESSILRAHAGDITGLAEADTLVEIGSGTSEKTLLLLDAMAASGSLRNIALLDISEEVLRDAAAGLSARYGVDVHAVVGDFRAEIGKVGRSGRQLWAFLGSTIGNFTPRERRRLLSDFRAVMGPDDRLLLGTDLIKAPARLVAAYDDAAGLTAAFNRNVLSVLNRELGASFDPELFDHRAVWNAEESWIEMRLVSRIDQTVQIEELGFSVHFDAGEEMLTEISSKFDPGVLPVELAGAGLGVEATWQDPAGDFMLTLARPER
jgi:L-histidine Nalpha-methyltransferase